MDSNETKITSGGLYVRGVVVSSSARTYTRKDDGHLGVKIQHEIATQPGVVMHEQYLDPKEHQEIKLSGDQVVSFPQFKLFSTLTLKALRFRFDRDKLIVTQSEQIA